MLLVVVVSVVMGILPMMIYASILWWLDRWEKEPLPLLAAAFIWGFIPSAIIALIAQIILGFPTSAVFGEHGLGYELFSGSIIAPITEEGVKAIAVLLIFIVFYREFDSPLDGIIYGSLAGFGFAAIENILYFVSSGSEDASSLGCLIFMRAFLFGLNHAFFTSLTGLGFALARYQKNILLKLLIPALGLMAAMIAHGIHNGLVTFGIVGLPLAVLADWFGILGVFVVILVSLYYEAKWIKQYLSEEVQLGTLTAAQAATAGSFSGRIGSNFASLGGGLGGWWKTRRFYQQCSELAYKKHQLNKMGDEGGNLALIEKLRAEVRGLSPVVGD
jgi:RsiW-degrading membrane proteinase PrsW (M82 family)